MSPLISAAASHVWSVLPPGDRLAINPQPLPPEADVAGALHRHRGDEAALNPQPLPPVEAGAHRGDEVALNPQPLPPRWLGTVIHDALVDAVALNPQPLPPRWAADHLDDPCGTVVPGHLPIPHPKGPLGEG